MMDLRDNDKAMPHDFHILNSKEKKLVSNLRGFTDSFRFHANRKRKKELMIRPEQQ